MIAPSLLAQVQGLSLDDRFFLIEAIRESIEADKASLDLSDEEKRELERRIQRHREHPEEVMTWEQVEEGLERE